MNQAKRENSFKSALQAGQLQIGLWLALANAYSAELCAGSGYDWLLIDGEHAPNDLRSILSALQATAPYGSHPVVRIPIGEASLIKQVLEVGATTLLVPMVESAGQAAELVKAMRYPPEGVRGVGSGIARSSRWGRDGAYLREANERVCLLVQVETISALAQLDAICDVEGVDGVFVGPADLAASMGYLGQPAHPHVVQAVEAAIARIVQKRRAAGILCTDPQLARRYIAAGASFVAVGVDTSLLVLASDQLLRTFRQSDSGVSAAAY
ncbi:4-hydroxy-2-oxoheptanedioate aldolase [Herbaspirillum sp. NPDC087042]|uniref:4-hydroxy-2-oxoheptanedioate aldolase n=1 Tax=Herbaspirillum sp. NPDC087042 TaxID=3364004 RepID=UPI0038224B26